MLIPKIAVCPICGKKTYLRIEDGGYLKEYPIRFHCINCRALIKGIYIMESSGNHKGLYMYNAAIEECDVDSVARKIRNADYVIDISGELPCKKVRVFDGSLIDSSPFIEATYQMDILERIDRLRLFAHNMEEWKKWRSIAFQLLDEGSIDYVSTALHHKMGTYLYPCDNHLKSLHCLQEVVQEETKSLFYPKSQEDTMKALHHGLSRIDRDALHTFVKQLGGTQAVIGDYRKVVGVFTSFMDIYSNLLPAETYMRYKEKTGASIGLATCSFSDIKTFYQDAYETILSMTQIPVCLDNILLRGSYLSFNTLYDGLFKRRNYVDLENDYIRYTSLDNGMKLARLAPSEVIQGMLNIPANRFLRNAIGHNSVNYDGLNQIIKVFDFKKPTEIKVKKSLIDMGVDCIGLARAAVILAEILLFILRQEMQKDGIHSIIHPRYYSDVERNDKCPCGSNRKYKICCKSDVEAILEGVSRSQPVPKSTGSQPVPGT